MDVQRSLETFKAMDPAYYSGESEVEFIRNSVEHLKAWRAKLRANPLPSQI